MPWPIDYSGLRVPERFSGARPIGESANREKGALLFFQRQSTSISGEPRTRYIVVEYPQPHRNRSREILRAHPEIRDLFGYDPKTAFWTLLLVGMQFLIAFFLMDRPLWLAIILAWCIGAFMHHALFVVMHECTHNLVFRTSFWNKMWGIVANLPCIVPSAIGFRNFHLLHHRYLGELGWDADLAGPREAAWVGNSAMRKFMWFLGFAIVEGIIRPRRVGKVKLVETWSLFNLVISAGAGLFVLGFWGWSAFLYLLFSLLFGIGLHPVGGRWIQEHYVVKEGQETYSYYGPLNIIALNVGYHNEHHAFMMIPWSKLPEVKRIAREFYEPLYAHTSWTVLFFRFLFDRTLNLYSRVVRPDHRLTSAGTPASRPSQASSRWLSPRQLFRPGRPEGLAPPTP
jgi:sphingolipid delta-4 desaturase